MSRQTYNCLGKLWHVPRAQMLCTDFLLLSHIIGRLLLEHDHQSQFTNNWMRMMNWRIWHTEIMDCNREKLSTHTGLISRRSTGALTFWYRVQPSWRHDYTSGSLSWVGIFVQKGGLYKLNCNFISFYAIDFKQSNWSVIFFLSLITLLTLCTSDWNIRTIFDYCVYLAG